MSSGIWTPLDRGRRQIRLVHLAPSEQLDEQPSCSLHIVSLDENPHYEALSYTWGDPKFTTPIQLRSVHQRSPTHVETNALSDRSLGLRTVTSLDTVLLQPPVTEIIASIRFRAQETPGLSPSAENKMHSAQWPVTTNLEAALRYLRDEFMERILWVDAICIDQSNIEERNHQVPLMKAIYSDALAVRVWLGNPTLGSDDAMVILKDLGQGVSLQEIRLQDRLVHDNDLQSIIELMTRPWWNRTWVQQELLLAKRAVFHCGFSSFEWSDMPSVSHFNWLVASAMKSLRFNEDVLDEFIDSFDAFTRIKNMAEIHEEASAAIDEGFFVILAHGRLCHNSDNRDSVYGFLGLTSEHVASKIMPDYNMSVADVFQDAATQLTVCSQSLILFSLTRYTTKKDRWTPTWVPSWHALSGLESVEEWSNRARRLAQHDFFLTCGAHNMKFEIGSRNILKLSGTRLDHVTSKSSAMAPSNPTSKEVLQLHLEWRLLCVLDIHDRSRYIAGGKASEAYWRTLVNDIYIGKAETRRRCQTKDHKAYLEWLYELENSTAVYWESDLANSYHISFQEACIGRRFFVTKKGYFGIGPAELEEGDEIYILAGGKHPFALRPPSESQPATFELVGDCYVHGIMDGEAVSDNGMGLGSLGEDSCEEFCCGQPPDPDLPLCDFHDVFIM